MIRILGAAITPLQGFELVGLGLYEGRRGVLVVTSASKAAQGGEVHPGPFAPEGEAFALAETEANSFLTEPKVYSSLELSGQSALPIERRLYEAGARRYVSIPLSSQQTLLGVLYAGFAGPGKVANETLAYLEQLVQILTPAFAHYRTRTRLAKGDRRRATLVELSHAINTSLRLETVLNSSREAIDRIEGHRVSIIGLFDDDQDLFRAYWQPRSNATKRGAPGEPEVLPIATSALAWVRQYRKTYESNDLQRQVAFELDTRLRDAGARRYAVAPMFVRGRIIGGFLFGTGDPHPALTTDVWLYENIALQLALAIDNALQFEELKRLTERLAQQNVYLREEISTEHNVEGMIGRSQAIRRVFDEIARVADTNVTVLIMGETGVGKELVARAIHAKSDRANHPLVKVNCAAIPENLVESELFGHERGAFTSATSRRIGRFELAREGTLFLDEIGELPLPIQAKLLRVLQDGEFERVGGSQTIKTDARILAATNRDLLDGLEKGVFRSDLYYRLNAFPITVPTLDGRRDDIPLLVEAFIAQINRKMGKDIRSIDGASLEYLRHHEWPGNIRELRHVIERAMILCDGTELVVERSYPTPARRVESTLDSRRVDAPLVVPAADATGLATMDAAERAHILRALEKTGWIIEGRRGAATMLRLKPSTLRSRMERLGIKRA